MLLRFLIPSGLAEVWCWLRDRPTADGLLSSYLRRFRVSSRFYSGKDYSLELAPLLPCRYRFPLFFPPSSRAPSRFRRFSSLSRDFVCLSLSPLLCIVSGRPGKIHEKQFPTLTMFRCAVFVYFSLSTRCTYPGLLDFEATTPFLSTCAPHRRVVLEWAVSPVPSFRFFSSYFSFRFFFYFLFFSLATHPLEIARIRAPCERRTRSLAQARTGFRAFSRRSTFQLGKINEA